MPTVPTVPNVKLNNGVEIPQLGFGVYLVPPEQTAEAVGRALQVGYRHIDTAQMYENERQVGEAIRNSGVDPSQIFVTTKLSNRFQTYDQALSGFEQSVEALGLEKIDLFLIHWPLPTLRDFVPTWKALERIYSEGRVRSIGVSNFTEQHLDRILEDTDVVPAVNQVEVHPYLTQEPLLAYGARHGIATEAWSPIAQGAVLDDPVITEIARGAGKTPAQVVLRWHIQLGNVVFPKSVTPSRIEENFRIFDFELSGDDVSRISARNQDRRSGPHPDVFEFVPR